MGATVSGSEIDEWNQPSDQSYIYAKSQAKIQKKIKKYQLILLRERQKKLMVSL